MFQLILAFNFKIEFQRTFLQLLVLNIDYHLLFKKDRGDSDPTLHTQLISYCDIRCHTEELKPICHSNDDRSIKSIVIELMATQNICLSVDNS